MASAFLGLLNKISSQTKHNLNTKLWSQSFTLLSFLSMVKPFFTNVGVATSKLIGAN